MPEYDNTNRGAIWKDEKNSTEKDRDFKGELNVEGVEYWVSAWKRKPDASAKAPALSFKIERKDQVPSKSRDENGKRVDMDDEIPFIMEWR